MKKLTSVFLISLFLAVGLRAQVSLGGSHKQVQGTLGLANGGTNNPSWTSSRCVQVSSDGTKLESAAGACGTSSSPLTTKGDLFTYSTTDDRLGVGTDGYCLVANSGTSTGLEWATCGGTATSNYEATFTGQTSVTVTGATHGMGNAHPLVQCYDNASPKKFIEPNSVTVDGTTFDVVITFSSSQTGSCVISGQGGSSGESNTASNVGTGGVGVYKQKTGANLEFKNIEAGTGITVTDDTGNSDVKIDCPNCSQASGTLTSGQLLQGSGSKDLAASGYTVQASGTGGTNPTNAGTSTELARKDHEHLIAWQTGLAFESTPSTGTFIVPMPVNNQCGGTISAVSVSVTAITQGSSTMTFNVIRYSNAGVSAGNLFSGTQTYSNVGNIRQGFSTDQNNTSLAATDYFRVNIITINGQAGFTVTVQGSCKNI